MEIVRVVRGLGLSHPMDATPFQDASLVNMTGDRHGRGVTRNIPSYHESMLYIILTKANPRPVTRVRKRQRKMERKFKVGDHVSWNSEAGRVRGTIKKKITSPIKFKNYTIRASKEEPQYLIKSDKTDHMAMHKGTALRKIGKSTVPQERLRRRKQK